MHIAIWEDHRSRREIRTRKEMEKTMDFLLRLLKVAIRGKGGESHS